MCLKKIIELNSTDYDFILFQLFSTNIKNNPYIEFPIPTNTTDNKITAIPEAIVHLVLGATPDHSFL